MNQRPRTPIERMVDEACGFDPGNPPPPKPSSPPDAMTNALLEVADAAKAWRRNQEKGKARLIAAVKAWEKWGG